MSRRVLWVGCLFAVAAATTWTAGSGSWGRPADPGSVTGAGRARCVDLFRPAPNSPARPGKDPGRIAVGDFNEDGRPDLAVTRMIFDGRPGPKYPGAVAVLLGIGDGTFSAAKTIPKFRDVSHSLVTGEFTGDGHADLVVSNLVDHTLTVLAGDGNVDFTRLAPLGTGDDPILRATADFNADGHTDLLLTDARYATSADANDGAWHLRLLLGNGSGGFTDAPGSPKEVNGPPWQAAASDVNGDGAPDAVVGFNYAPDVVQVFLGDGTGSLRPVPAAVNWQKLRRYDSRSVWLLEASDINADGRQDIALVLQGRRDAVVLLGDGAGHFRERARPYRDGEQADSMAIGRFNGDRFPDIALTFSTVSPHPGDVSVFLGEGNGGFFEAPGSPEHPGSVLHGLEAADFNLDGRDDLAMLDVPTASSGTLPVLLNTRGRRRAGERVPVHIGSVVPEREYGPIIYGDKVGLSGYLTCERDALAGRRLALYRRLTGPKRPWRRISTKTTNSGGTVATSDRPPANAQYQWRPVDSRRPRLKTSPLAAVRVQQAVPITVRESRVTGQVLPPHPGALVRLSRSNEQGQDEEEWTEVARTRLSARSTFSFALTGLRPRRGLYHVFRPADEDHGTGTSEEFRIR